MHGTPMMFNFMHLLAWNTRTCILNSSVRIGIQSADVIVFVLPYTKPSWITPRLPYCRYLEVALAKMPTTTFAVHLATGNGTTLGNYTASSSFDAHSRLSKPECNVKAHDGTLQWLPVSLSQAVDGSKSDWPRFCSFCFSVNTANEKLPIVSGIEYFHLDKIAVASYPSPMVAVYHGLGMVWSTHILLCLIDLVFA